MIKSVCFELYNHSEYYGFNFEFEEPCYIDIRPVSCGDFGDRNYKQFGLVSGCYVQNYFIFELTDVYKNKIYVVAQEDFWDTNPEEYEWEFEFSGRKIKLSTKLGNAWFGLMTEEQLNEYYDYMDSI